MSTELELDFAETLDFADEPPRTSANALLVDYLIHSCIYYKLNGSVISDHEFDGIARELAARWDEVTHRHRSLIDIASLRQSTSGYYIQFPSIVLSCAERVLRGEYSKRVPKEFSS